MWIPRDPTAGNPGDSDRVCLTHIGESDSLTLTHSGDIWQKHFNPGNSAPNLKELLHIFSLFHLLLVNPHPLTQGFSDRKWFVCVSFTCSSSCICMKAHVTGLANMTKNWQSWSIVWYTTPTEEHFDIKIIHSRAEIHLWQGTFDP